MIKRTCPKCNKSWYSAATRIWQCSGCGTQLTDKMHNLPKINSWIQSSVKEVKSGSKRMFIYDAANAWVSDASVVLPAINKVKPKLLEMFGHLDGGAITPTGQTNEIPDLIQFLPSSKDLLYDHRIFDSRLILMYNKQRYRILWHGTDKLVINQKYIDLFDNFSLMELFVTEKSGVAVYCGFEFAGLVMPIRPAGDFRDLLATFKFAYAKEKGE